MNAGSTWGNSTGFGGSSLAQPAQNATGSSSLFGNSNPAPSLSLFGNTNSQSNSGGLFGNSSSTTAPASSGGLFGNLNGAKPSTGLFGSTSQTAAPTNNSASNGGLFGGSSSGGLFGNSAKRAVSEGPTSGGLFSGTTPSTGGLFGSTTGQNTTGVSLNGSAPQSSGLFGNSAKPQSSGLFGSSTNAPSSGLFGSSNAAPSGLLGASLGGLFGQSNLQKSNLFGNSSSAAQTAPNASVSSTAYGADSILSAISTTEASMPMSITSSMFGTVHNANAKKHKAAVPSSKSFKSSLLGKLAQTFNIFRPSNAANTNLKGIFTQPNYVKDIPAAETSKFKVQKQNAKEASLARSLGTVNKLVVKSKPSKFHLINADKVFKAKMTRTLTARDDDISETESLEESPIPEPIADRSSKRAKTMEGRGIQSKDILAEDKTDDSASNNGYFCFPTIKELAAMSPAQLTQVPNFIIGRVGHGQIAYNLPVDVSNIFGNLSFDTKAIAEELFGRLFVFNSPYVVVYDDRLYKAPPQFSELNFPATVTMKVPPKKNGTIEDLISALKNVTGQAFVTYDPITYNWTSQVEHFSVWGLLDDDEVEGDEVEEIKRLREIKKRQDETEVENSVLHANSYQNETYQNELKRQKIERQTNGIPGGWEFDTTIKVDGGLLSVKQKLVQNEINQEVNQFKTDKSAIYIATNASDITSDSESESVNGRKGGLALDGPLFPDEVRNYDYIKEFVNAAPTSLEMENIIDEKAYEPELDDDNAFNYFESTSSFPTSKNWLLQLELANDVSSALAPALTRPRKLQPVLNTVNDILFSDLPINNESYQASTPMKEVQESRLFLDDASKFETELLGKFTKEVLTQSSIETRENKFPLLKLDEKLTFQSVSALSGEALDAQYLRLGSILFDKPDLRVFAKYRDLDHSNLPLVKRLECVEERRALATWLKLFNKEIYEDLSLSDEPLDKIFTTVCEGKLKDAAALAIESDNLHLAPLLTLMDSNDSTVKSIAEGQIVSWNESGYSEFVPPSTLKLYRILAGDFASFVGELPDYVCLGLEVFFGNSAESVSSLISRFSQIVDLEDELGSILRTNSAFKADLFAESSKILVDSKLSPKLKWIFHQIISNEGAQYKPAQDAVGIAFGLELEKCGLWKEALYVYASMADDEQVKTSIRSAVIKSVEHFENSKEEQDFLQKTIKIPRELVYEAISLSKGKKEDYWGCGEALVLAEMWDEAHKLICEKLAPLAIIEEGSYMKTVVMALIDSFPQNGRVVGSWNQGAGLFSKYFQVTEQADNGEAVEASDIVYMLDNLGLIPKGKNFLVNVATQIMTKRIGDIAVENQSKIGHAKEKILNLSLGDNEKTYFTTRLQ